MIKCVYPEHHKYKMSTSLHAVFKVVPGNVYFVSVFSSIHSRKMRFSGSTQNSMSEKSIFGQFKVIFLNVKMFPRLGVVFSC